MAYLFQTDQGMCGDVALRHLLAAIHGDDRFLLINRRLNPGASMAAIVSLARLYGVFLNGYKVTSLKKRRPVDFPVIAIVTENGNDHYVFISRPHRGKHLVKDGASRPYRSDLDDLEDKFAGYVLTVGERRPYRLLDSEYASNRVPHRAINTTLFILGLLAALTGLFLIDTSVRFVYPVILFTIAAIVTIVQQRLLIAGMRHYDKEMMENQKNSVDWKFLQSYYLHKRLSFSQPYALIGHIAGVIVPTLFLAINDWTQIFYLTFVALLAIIVRLFSNKKLDMLNKIIAEQESQIGVKHGNFDMNKLNQTTYRLANLKTSMATITIMAVSLTSLLYSALQGAVYLNFFMFHFYAYYLMAANIVKLLESGAERQQFLQLSYQLLIH